MLTYRQSGSGPAVVLLHGFPLSHAIWEHQIAALSGTYRVIAPDLPGMGGSALLPEGEASMARYAREVLNLVDSLGVGPFALAGHSMGGYVALALQKEAPQRVAGLGLVASQAGADTPEGREGRFATAEKVRAEGPGVVAGAMGPKLFGSGVTPEDPRYRQVDAIMRGTAPEGIRAALFAMAGREDMQPRLPTIGGPALVLAGEQDKIIPVEKAETVAANLKAATLVKLPCGHMPMLEEPEATSAALSRWLSLVF